MYKGKITSIRVNLHVMSMSASTNITKNTDQEIKIRPKVGCKGVGKVMAR